MFNRWDVVFVWLRWTRLLVCTVLGSVGSVVLVCLATLGGGSSDYILRSPSSSCSCCPWFKMEVSCLIDLLWSSFACTFCGMLVCSLTSISCATCRVLSVLLIVGMSMCLGYRLYMPSFGYALVLCCKIWGGDSVVGIGPLQMHPLCMLVMTCILWSQWNQELLFPTWPWGSCCNQTALWGLRIQRFWDCFWMCIVGLECLAVVG